MFMSNICSTPEWRGQANLVASLLASIPDGNTYAVGDGEKMALVTLLEKVAACGCKAEGE